MAEVNMDQIRSKEDLDRVIDRTLGVSSSTSERGIDKAGLSPVVKKDSLVRTKKSLGRKFKEAFISDDVKDVKSYLFFDVVVPTVKDAILDAWEMIFFGSPSGRRGSRNRRYDRDRDYRSYDQYYKSSEYGGRRRERDRDRDDDRRYRGDDKVDYRDIVLRDRMDAEEVVRKLRDRIEEYDQATVADLYDLIDISSSYVDNNWGWDRQEDIGIRRVREGYLIDVAEAKYLN